MRKHLLALAGLAALSASGAALRADTVLTLGAGNSAISSFSSPYATVNIHLNSPTQATFTFTRASNYLLGGQGIAGVNINASSFALVTPLGGELSGGGSGSEDGFGNFNVSLDNF